MATIATGTLITVFSAVVRGMAWFRGCWHRGEVVSGASSRRHRSVREPPEQPSRVWHVSVEPAGALDVGMGSGTLAFPAGLGTSVAGVDAFVGSGFTEGALVAGSDARVGATCERAAFDIARVVAADREAGFSLLAVVASATRAVAGSPVSVAVDAVARIKRSSNDV